MRLEKQISSWWAKHLSNTLYPQVESDKIIELNHSKKGPMTLFPKMKRREEENQWGRALQHWLWHAAVYEEGCASTLTGTEELIVQTPYNVGWIEQIMERRNCDRGKKNWHKKVEFLTEVGMTQSQGYWNLPEPPRCVTLQTSIHKFLYKIGVQ